MQILSSHAKVVLNRDATLNIQNTKKMPLISLFCSCPMWRAHMPLSLAFLLSLHDISEDCISQNDVRWCTPFFIMLKSAKHAALIVDLKEGFPEILVLTKLFRSFSILARNTYLEFDSGTGIGSSWALLHKGVFRSSILSCDDQNRRSERLSQDKVTDWF